MHGRGVTRQLRPSIPDWRPRVKQAQARLRMLSGEEANHASSLCTRRAVKSMVGVGVLDGPHQREATFNRPGEVVRCVSFGLQCQTNASVSR